MKPLSCPYFMTTKGGQEQFPGKELLYFFGQTMQLLAARFCMATIQGRRLKPADVNDGWKRYVWAIQRRLLDAGSSTHNLSVLLSAIEKGCTTRIALALAWWPSSELFAYVWCAACCCHYYSRAGLVKETRYHHHHGVCKTFAAAAATVYQEPHF